jgi:glycosyltransferase involved in cell wall biosynthesis
VRSDLELSARPILAGVGFLLPHKGILQTLRAVGVLRASYPGILYLGVHAVHPDPSSTEHLELCRREIVRLGLERHVLLFPQFLPVEEVLTLLHAADVVMLPYSESTESTSAAIRLALASRRPVLTTRLPIFDDVAGETYQIESSDPDCIAEGARVLLCDQPRAAELVDGASRRIEATSWREVARLHLKILCGAIARERRGSGFSAQAPPAFAVAGLRR